MGENSGDNGIPQLNCSAKRTTLDEAALPGTAEVFGSANGPTTTGTIASPDNMITRWMEGKYLGLLNMVLKGYRLDLESDCTASSVHTMHVRLVSMILDLLGTSSSRM